MEILLSNLGKRYGRRWIFKGLNQMIGEGESWAICGRNGAGKSTLLKILANYHTASKGHIAYKSNGKAINADEATCKISYTGPDQHLIEELTLEEHLGFHFQFKAPLISQELMLEKCGLSEAEKVYIRDFSSGMKQRLKLALALYSISELMLLDEPTAFMDESGIDWYRQEVKERSNAVTIIVASNQRYEFEFTHNIIKL